MCIHACVVGEGAYTCVCGRGGCAHMHTARVEVVVSKMGLSCCITSLWYCVCAWVCGGGVIGTTVGRLPDCESCCSYHRFKRSTHGSKSSGTHIHCDAASTANVR